jgi:hypothetical protein
MVEQVHAATDTGISLASTAATQSTRLLLQANMRWRYRDDKGWEGQQMKLPQTMALAATLLVATASAGLCTGFDTGSILLERCSAAKSKETYYLQLIQCLGYITAIADAANCEDDVDGYHWQSPKGVTREQLKRVVTKWLNKHPEKLHFVAASLVAAALEDAFPCK